jgi:hypothetical protein
VTQHLVQWFYDDATGDLLPALPESPDAPAERGENAEIVSAAQVETRRERAVADSKIDAVIRRR